MKEVPLLDSEPIDHRPTKKEWFKAKLTVQFAVVVLLVLLTWGAAASLSAYRAGLDNAALRASTEKRIGQAAKAADERARKTEKAGLERTVQAVAASLKPFQQLQSQPPEITRRTMQSVVRGIIADRTIRFVAIVDGSGKVIASSDLALVGRPLSTPGGLLVATSPIDAGRMIVIGAARSQ